jgi:hypothetical protein
MPPKKTRRTEKNTSDISAYKWLEQTSPTWADGRDFTTRYPLYPNLVENVIERIAQIREKLETWRVSQVNPDKDFFDESEKLHRDILLLGGYPGPDRILPGFKRVVGRHETQRFPAVSEVVWVAKNMEPVYPLTEDRDAVHVYEVPDHSATQVPQSMQWNRILGPLPSKLEERERGVSGAKRPPPNPHAHATNFRSEVKLPRKSLDYLVSGALKQSDSGRLPEDITSNWMDNQRIVREDKFVNEFITKVDKWIENIGKLDRTVTRAVQLVELFRTQFPQSTAGREAVKEAKDMMVCPFFWYDSAEPTKVGPNGCPNFHHICVSPCLDIFCQERFSRCPALFVRLGQLSHCRELSLCTLPASYVAKCQPLKVSSTAVTLSNEPRIVLKNDALVAPEQSVRFRHDRPIDCYMDSQRISFAAFATNKDATLTFWGLYCGYRTVNNEPTVAGRTFDDWSYSFHMSLRQTVQLHGGRPLDHLKRLFKFFHLCRAAASVANLVTCIDRVNDTWIYNHDESQRQVERDIVRSGRIPLFDILGLQFDKDVTPLFDVFTEKCLDNERARTLYLSELRNVHERVNADQKAQIVTAEATIERLQRDNARGIDIITRQRIELNGLRGPGGMVDWRTKHDELLRTSNNIMQELQAFRAVGRAERYMTTRGGSVGLPSCKGWIEAGYSIQQIDEVVRLAFEMKLAHPESFNAMIPDNTFFTRERAAAIARNRGRGDDDPTPSNPGHPHEQWSQHQQQGHPAVAAPAEPKTPHFYQSGDDGWEPETPRSESSTPTQSYHTLEPSPTPENEPRRELQRNYEEFGEDEEQSDSSDSPDRPGDGRVFHSGRASRTSSLPLMDDPSSA